jgi:hypothetical protein
VLISGRTSQRRIPDQTGSAATAEREGNGLLRGRIQRAAQCLVRATATLPLPTERVRVAAGGVRRQTSNRQCGRRPGSEQREGGRRGWCEEWVSLVPLVWESNPKLQGGWCKPNHQPIGGSDPNHQGIWSPPNPLKTTLSTQARYCRYSRCTGRKLSEFPFRVRRGARQREDGWCGDI